MLNIKNLDATIDNKHILKGLNLNIKPGEVHAIMGPNGSGKSTLANVLSGKNGYEIKGDIQFNGENLNEPARIWISTIHAAKGGEEDNVILCLDIGDKIKKAMLKSVDKHDEEHRVWYVGITRARNNLYKLKANLKRNEYKL